MDRKTEIIVQARYPFCSASSVMYTCVRVVQSTAVSVTDHHVCSNCCAVLPSTGAACMQDKTSFMSQLFTQYVECRVASDWRFCIVSTLQSFLLLPSLVAVRFCCALSISKIR